MVRICSSDTGRASTGFRVKWGWFPCVPCVGASGGAVTSQPPGGGIKGRFVPGSDTLGPG